MHSAPPVGAGDSTVGSNPAANPCVTRRTERLKNLSLLRESCSVCKIFQLCTQKSFSSIAHNEQSSKKYFAESKRVGRARDAFDGKLQRRIDLKLKLRRRARANADSLCDHLEAQRGQLPLRVGGHGTIAADSVDLAIEAIWKTNPRGNLSSSSSSRPSDRR
jgi:hypothetical protein